MEDHSQDEVWDVLAQTFSSLNDLEFEDDVSLDVKEGFRFQPRRTDGRFAKTPLSESKVYVAFHQAARDLLDGRLDKAAFVDQVSQLADLQRKVLSSLESPKVEQRYAALSEDENRLYREIRRCFGQICAGADLMLTYRHTDNPDDVKQGLRVLAQAFVALDQAQEEVVELGQRHG